MKDKDRTSREGRKSLALALSVLMLSLAINVPASLAQTFDISYDANGNRQEGFGLYHEYDDFNKLVRVRQDNSTGPIIEEYVYDEGDRRLKKYEPQIDQTTYYIDRNWIRVVNSSGTFDYTYYYDGDTLVARMDPDGSKYFYHPDHLGSTTLITDENGDVVEEITYEPYGSHFSGGSDRFMYTGKELDAGTGLQYYGARYYDPAYSQFTQPDWIIQDIYNPQNLNRYSYTLNNPYRYTDPTGNEPVIAQLNSYIDFISELSYFDTTTASGSLNNLATFSGSRIHRADFIANSKSRYAYSTQVGFIDHLHVLTTATAAKNYGGEIAWILGWLHEATSGSVSRFSYEDLSSNALGIEFASQLNDEEPLSVQYQKFLETKGVSADALKTFAEEYPDLKDKIPEFDDPNRKPLAWCSGFCPGKAVPTYSTGSNAISILSCRNFGTCGENKEEIEQ